MDIKHILRNCLDTFRVQTTQRKLEEQKEKTEAVRRRYLGVTLKLETLEEVLPSFLLAPFLPR